MSRALNVWLRACSKLVPLTVLIFYRVLLAIYWVKSWNGFVKHIMLSIILAIICAYWIHLNNWVCLCAIPVICIVSVWKMCMMVYVLSSCQPSSGLCLQDRLQRRWCDGEHRISPLWDPQVFPVCVIQSLVDDQDLCCSNHLLHHLCCLHGMSDACEFPDCELYEKQRQRKMGPFELSVIAVAFLVTPTGNSNLGGNIV